MGRAGVAAPAVCREAQLGEGLGASIPPQVTSVARKPLSIAFEEIAADKIVPIEAPEEEEGAEEAELTEPVAAE